MTFFFFFTPFATIIGLSWFVETFPLMLDGSLFLLPIAKPKEDQQKKSPTCSQSNQCTHTFYLSNIFYSVTEISSTGLASTGTILVDLKTIKNSTTRASLFQT